MIMWVLFSELQMYSKSAAEHFLKFISALMNIGLGKVCMPF